MSEVTRQDDHSNKLAHRVIALLDREQVDFLDEIGKDALFSTGTKLSRTKIIAAMVNAMRRMGVNGHGVRSVRELELRISEEIAREGSAGDEGGAK
ncbi:MAG: hypothetical protein JW937_09830 [Candidatus Omnitrophica bacterium]|nr:hypothetical protein [Candidatus Omnitrophota bacterium]